jgi:hypothetical protein
MDGAGSAGQHRDGGSWTEVGQDVRRGISSTKDRFVEGRVPASRPPPPGGAAAPPQPGGSGFRYTQAEILYHQV